MKHFPLFFFWLLVQVPALAQQRPLVTERAETIEKGCALLDIGIEFLQDAVFPFSGLRGDLTRAGVVGLRLGVSENVELQTLGSIQNILNVEERFVAPNTERLRFSGNSTSDVGDFTLATKVRLSEGRGTWPALALRFGAEIPNASNESGLGNDETNLFGSLLLEKHFGQLMVLTNVGLALLGDPVTPGSQDDLLTYGLALSYPVHGRVSVLADAHGRAGAAGVGTEEQTQLRLGTQIRAAGLYWDAALFIGFRATDPASGFVFGISKEFAVPFLGR